MSSKKVTPGVEQSSHEHMVGATGLGTASTAALVGVPKEIWDRVTRALSAAGDLSTKPSIFVDYVEGCRALLSDVEQLNIGAVRLLPSHELSGEALELARGYDLVRALKQGAPGLYGAALDNALALRFGVPVEKVIQARAMVSYASAYDTRTGEEAYAEHVANNRAK